MINNILKNILQSENKNLQYFLDLSERKFPNRSQNKKRKKEKSQKVFKQFERKKT